MKYYCPPSCPSFSGYMPELPEALGACALCYTKLREGDRIYKYKSKLLCKDCANDVITEALMEFLDISSQEELFDMLC